MTLTKQHTGLRAVIALFTLLAASVSAGANAQTCDGKPCWGAVAFNAQSGAFGCSYSYLSEKDAARAAREGCGHNCPEVKTFSNQCGAAAIGYNGGYGWGFGSSGFDAEIAALSHCSKYDHGCQVLVWSCSG